MLKATYSLPSLPPPQKLETEAVLRAAAIGRSQVAGEAVQGLHDPAAPKARD